MPAGYTHECRSKDPKIIRQMKLLNGLHLEDVIGKLTFQKKIDNVDMSTPSWTAKTDTLKPDYKEWLEDLKAREKKNAAKKKQFEARKDEWKKKDASLLKSITEETASQAASSSPRA